MLFVLLLLSSSSSMVYIGKAPSAIANSRIVLATVCRLLRLQTSPSPHIGPFMMSSFGSVTFFWPSAMSFRSGSRVGIVHEMTMLKQPQRKQLVNVCLSSSSFFSFCHSSFPSTPYRCPSDSAYINHLSSFIMLHWPALAM